MVSKEPTAVGDWIKCSTLGSGGFGVVNLWMNSTTNEQIAIKKCKWTDPEMIPPRQKGRWCKEVEIMKEIRHRNIVSYKPMPQVLAAELLKYNTSQLPMLSMEYCVNGNLRNFLKKPENVMGLQEDELRYFLKDVNAGIAYLHQKNVTHRDIKPENIVRQKTDQRPNGNTYKLIDLGYAKELNSATVSFVGTLLYLAPEILDTKHYNSNVDYWSFGLVVFEVITGVLPFLNNSNPIKRHEYISKKSPEHIYIFMGPSGDVKYSEEITIENNISSCLRKQLERWLKIMLKFKPSERGITGTSRNVFEELDYILNKNIVRVFSVYNYDFFHYEIDDNMMMSSLQRRIAADTKISVEDQLIITDNMFYDAKDRRVTECFDEIKPNSLMVLFSKACLHNVPEFKLPLVVKGIFTIKFNTWDLLQKYTSCSANYILKEAKLMRCMKKALSVKHDYAQNLFQKECKSLENLKEVSNRLLIEIEVLKNLIASSLGKIVTTDWIKEHKKCLRQCKELIENVNAAYSRHHKLLLKEAILGKSYDRVSVILNGLNQDNHYEKAIACTTLNNELSSSPIVMAINCCLKERSNLLCNADINKHFQASMKFIRETSRLLKWTGALENQIKNMQVQLVSNKLVIQQAAVPKVLAQPMLLMSNSCIAFEQNANDLIEVNMDLRYRIQENINQLQVVTGEDGNGIRAQTEF